VDNGKRVRDAAENTRGDLTGYVEAVWVACIHHNDTLWAVTSHKSSSFLKCELKFDLC